MDVTLQQIKPGNDEDPQTKQIISSLEKHVEMRECPFAMFDWQLETSGFPRKVTDRLTYVYTYVYIVCVCVGVLKQYWRVTEFSMSTYKYIYI